MMSLFRAPMAHNDTAYCENNGTSGSPQRTKSSIEEIKKTYTTGRLGAVPVGDQLIKQEERETGNTGLKPYIQYLNQSNGFFYLSLAVISHILYLVGQLVQNLWLASELDDANTSTLKLLATYVAIGGGMTLTLVLRSYVVAVLGLKTSKAIFSKLMMSLFRAPMAFYDSTPPGRILSRVIRTSLSSKMQKVLKTKTY